MTSLCHEVHAPALRRRVHRVGRRVAVARSEERDVVVVPRVARVDVKIGSPVAITAVDGTLSIPQMLDP